MSKFLLTVCAFGLLVPSSPATATPLTDSDKSGLYNLINKGCVEKITRDSPKTPLYYPRPPFTEQEISDYCSCNAEVLADLMTKEEYALKDFRTDSKSTTPPASVIQSVIEKIKCIAVEKCKKHLNLPDPSQFQYEECWKG
jgi:hypothetical protein